MRRLLELMKRRRAAGAPAAPPVRGLGEPPAPGADDAELDALRGELMRELDRMASRPAPRPEGRDAA